MAIIGLLTEKSKKVEKFVADCNTRINDPHKVGNLIDGDIFFQDWGGKYLVIMDIETMMGFVSFIFFRVFQARFFVRLALKKGLRKAGYMDNMKFLSSHELLSIMAGELKNGRT